MSAALAGSDLVFNGGWNQNVAVEAEEVRLVDGLPTFEPLQESMLAEVLEEARDVESFFIVQSGVHIGDGDDGVPHFVEELGRDSSHVSRPLNHDAATGFRHLLVPQRFTDHQGYSKACGFPAAP